MWAMIAVSIAMAIWTCGLQIIERKYRKTTPVTAGGQTVSEELEKETISGEEKL